MKRTISTFILTLIAIITISCGGGGSSENTIGFMLWGSAPQRPKWNRLVKKFEDQNPGVKVNLLFSTYNGYSDKLLTTLSGGGENVDIFRIMNLTPIAERDALEEVGDYFNGEILPEKSDFFPNALKGVTYGGKFKAVPYGIDAAVIYVNVDIFNKAGVDIPKGRYTISELEAMVKKLSTMEGEKIYGFSMDINPGRYLPLVRNLGGKVYDPSSDTVNFDNPEFKRIVRMLHTFIQNNYMASLDSAEHSGFAGFQTGKNAMYVAGKYLVPELHKHSTFNWDVIRFPVEPGIKPFEQSSDNYIGIRRGTAKKDICLKFLQFLYTEEACRVLIKGGDYIPPIKSLAFADEFVKYDRIDNKIFIDAYNDSQDIFFAKHRDNDIITEHINKEVWTFLLEKEPDINKYIENIHRNLGEHYKTQ